MALFETRFFSNALGICVSVNVITPERRTPDVEWSTLYLLHGWSDDHSIWLRRTAIERHVAGKPLCVVMPAVSKSYYTNMKQGYRYWDFVADELPVRMQEFFGLSQDRERNFTAGNSMGGYGAFKLALARPDRYCAAASLAGALDVETLFKSDRKVNGEKYLIWGNPIQIPPREDLFKLARTKKWAKYKTKFYQWCGTEDFLYNDNIRFRELAKKLKMPLEFHEGPGAHEWAPWDFEIKKVIDWLPLKQ